MGRVYWDESNIGRIGMMMTDAINKPNLIEIAKKQREVKLIEKMQKGIPLSQSEMKELAKYQDGGSLPGILDSQDQVAKVFRVTSRTVANWVKDGMPVTKEGRYDIVEIQTWRFHKKNKKRTGDEDDDWDAKYREYKAKLEQIKFKTTIGELIPMREVEAGLIQISIAIKRALLALPRSVAPRLVGLESREIENILRERVEEIINLFAQDNIFKKDDKAQEKTKNLD